MLFKLGDNIGYHIEGVTGSKYEGNFADKQKGAWDLARQALDQGLPCYGWELDIPEYYVVYGYDDEGYYFSGPLCDSGKGPKPWRELGVSNIGLLEMYRIEAGKAADDDRTVRDAFQFALEHSKSPEKWIFPKYRAGTAGFDNWTGALETGTANGQGMGYNAVCWSECREYAVGFLREARERLGGMCGPLFDEAVEHYKAVHQHLQKVAELFPFPPRGDEVKDEERCKTAIAYLGNARKAEEAGLGLLERLVKEL